MSFFLSLASPGQNLVGYTGKAILKFMKENNKEMQSEKVTNKSFKYLKYSDRSDNQTLFFFLNNDSVCTSVRLICELGIKSMKVKEFNSIYLRKEENVWIDKHDGKDYRIEIKDGVWSCTITISPEK